MHSTTCQIKILAADHQTVLPDETLIAKELERTREELERRRSRDDTGANASAES
jgi:hypothetical protein